MNKPLGWEMKPLLCASFIYWSDPLLWVQALSLEQETRACPGWAHCPAEKQKPLSTHQQHEWRGLWWAAQGTGVAQRSREAQYKCSEKASLGIGGRRLGGSICGNVLVIHEPSRHSTNARCAESAITPDCHGRFQFSANPRKFSYDRYLVPIPVRFGGIVCDEKIHTHTHVSIYKDIHTLMYIQI